MSAPCDEYPEQEYLHVEYQALVLEDAPTEIIPGIFLPVVLLIICLP